MNNEQQAQAKYLYFQTDMSKTQIAELLAVPRRTLHYWIREKNWDRLKQGAAHMPSLLAEKCYHLIAQFTDQLLSEERIKKPITHQEADTLHKLTLVANKLKNRSTLNESMEMFGFFMERVNQKSPELADIISPIVNEYISSRANMQIADFRPDNFNSLGLIPQETPDLKEIQLDLQDITAWTDVNKPVIDIEQLRFKDDPSGTIKTLVPDNQVMALETNPDSMPSAAWTGEKGRPQPLPVGQTTDAPAQNPGEGLGKEKHIAATDAPTHIPETEKEYRTWLPAEHVVYDTALPHDVAMKDSINEQVKEAA